MKKNILILTVVLFSCFHCPRLFAQGDPRTPISSAPFTITNPGSYYLTTNLFAGNSGSAIIIAANNVALDLGGFTIFATEMTTNNGIEVGAVANVTIVNGFISSQHDRGFAHGMYSSPPFHGYAYNVRVSGVTVSDCWLAGIMIGYEPEHDDLVQVQSCNVYNVGAYGIMANSASDCTASGCSQLGIAAGTAHNCHAVGPGAGIYAFNTAINCVASVGGACGIDAVIVENCYGINFSGGQGIRAQTVLNSFGYSLSGYGIWAYKTANNSSGESDTGIGFYADNIAIGCFGGSAKGIIGLRAWIANSCWGSGRFPLFVFHKYNMP